MASVLIVDDLPAVHEMLEAVINPCGFLSAFALSGEEGIKRYREGNIDVVLVDINMEPMDGITVLKELKAIDPNAVVIMMTGYSSTETAMQALKYGAFDYVQKPFRVEELVKTLHRAVDAHKMESAGAPAASDEAAKEEERADFDVAGALLGHSEAIRKVKNNVKKLLEAHAPVLIQGEPGTGKRALADLIHKEGVGEDKPFKGIDCALADPEELRAKLVSPDGSPGELLQSVRGGTLLFHHIEEMPKDLQDMLAAVLQVTAKEFRFICSTSINLEGKLAHGKLSEDLYFKIATLPITMPPLRERREDIPVLVEDILKKTRNPSVNTDQIEFSRDAEKILNEYPWPGNITEMSNMLTSLVAATTQRVISADDLPEHIKNISEWPTLQDYLSRQKDIYVARVLHACNNDKEWASKIAGVEDIDEPMSFAEGAGEALTEEDREALEKLKAELEMQQQQIEEAKSMLQEREQFIEMSETTLFEKVQQQQETETELEQLREDLKKREKAVAEKEKEIEAG